jgi:serine/threonine-protein kinase HipA
VGAQEKYVGGDKSPVLKRLRDFVTSADAPYNLRTLFHLFALNCALRIGDALFKEYRLIFRVRRRPRCSVKQK